MQPKEPSAFRPVPWFLATAPSPSAEMVERRSVAQLLDDHVAAHHATVVSAPSGFGKTVAVGQWAAHQDQSSPGSVSWLTLTGRVAQIGDVLPGLVTALQLSARRRGDTVFHRALAPVFDATSSSDALSILKSIDAPRPVTIAIDDFQYAGALLGEPDLISLIEHGPGWLRLVLMTTDAVEPELTRLRLHGRVAVIGASELALTTDEIANAATLLGAPIDGGRAEAIRTATGGWPAAVRLALISGGALPSFTAGPELTEYVRTAVLGRMRPGLADFVLRATVSTRVNERLACLLAERDDAARLLTECVSGGLFIERYSEGDDVVYQWHSLFVRHCRIILRQQDPDRWQSLNRLAAHELGAQYPLQAVVHAIKADDAQLATDAITDHWLELLLQSRWGRWTAHASKR